MEKSQICSLFDRSDDFAYASQSVLVHRAELVQYRDAPCATEAWLDTLGADRFNSAWVSSSAWNFFALVRFKSQSPLARLAFCIQAGYRGVTNLATSLTHSARSSQLFVVELPPARIYNH